MSAYLRFLAVGLVFAAVEEILTVWVLRGDLGGLLVALLVLFPVYLTVAYLAGRAANRLIPAALQREVTYYLTLGLLGVMIEWFLIGLPPWSDPDAEPLLMLVFQLGMFSFWASVAYLPRLFTQPPGRGGPLNAKILWFYVPYFLIVYFVAFTISPQLRFNALIALIIFGYMFLNLFYLRYFAFLAGRRITRAGSPRNSA